MRMFFLIGCVTAVCFSCGAGEPAATVSDGAKLNQALESIQSSDETAREAAAKALLVPLADLIRATKPVHLAKLNEDIHSAEASRRSMAVKALAAALTTIQSSGPRLLPEIFAALNGPDAAARQQACADLAKLINESIESSLTDKLINDLGSADAAEAASARRQLTEMGGDAARSLADALEDEKSAVRNASAEILKAMGTKAKEAVDALAFLLESDTKASRRLAADVLENLGPDAAEVAFEMVQYLEHDEKPVRRMAASILKKMGPAAHEEAGNLADLLISEEKSVRGVATELLLAMGSVAKEAVESAKEILDDTSNDADARERAANVLGAIGPGAKEALEVLTKYKNDEHPGVKAAVGQAITKIESAAPGGK